MKHSSKPSCDKGRSASSKLRDIKDRKAVMPSRLLLRPWTNSSCTKASIVNGWACSFFATVKYLLTVSVLHSDASRSAIRVNVSGESVPQLSTISHRTKHLDRADNPITLRFFSSSSKLPRLQDKMANRVMNGSNLESFPCSM